MAVFQQSAKGETVVWATVGDQVKVTVDGTTADGKKLHTEWTGKVDGKDYPLTGIRNSTLARSR